MAVTHLAANSHSQSFVQYKFCIPQKPLVFMFFPKTIPKILGIFIIIIAIIIHNGNLIEPTVFEKHMVNCKCTSHWCSPQNGQKCAFASQYRRCHRCTPKGRTGHHFVGFGASTWDILGSPCKFASWQNGAHLHFVASSSLSCPNSKIAEK